MRTIKLLILIVLIYAIFRHQPVYLSSAQQENPDKAQIEVVEKFFAQYNSPLRLHAVSFLKAAKENDLDYRLLPAVTMVESTGGKFVPSCAPYNPFGWYSSTSPCGFYRFKSFDEAIFYVADKISHGRNYPHFQRERTVAALAENYNENPEDWTWKVEFFMEKIK